jgi:hypothetical protein
MSLGGGSTTSTTTSELSDQAQKLIDPLIPTFTNYAANPPTLPEYSGISPFTPEQLQAQQMLMGTAPAQAQLGQAASSSNQFLMDPSILYPESNPALQATINAAIQPIQQELYTQTMPYLTTSAETSGGYGTTNQAIQKGLAVQGEQQAEANAAAPIANAGYQAGLTAMNQAVQQAPATSQALTAPALSVGAVGDVQQQMNQQLLDEQIYKESTYPQIAPFLAASDVAAIASGLGGGTTTSTMPAPTTSPLTAVPGALSLIGALFGL